MPVVIGWPGRLFGSFLRPRCQRGFLFSAVSGTATVTRYPSTASFSKIDSTFSLPDGILSKKLPYKLQIKNCHLSIFRYRLDG